MMAGMFRARPVHPPHEPDWSLDAVLDFLSSARFENPSFSDLAHKCVFLLGLATGDRVSELHSYLRDGEHVIFGEGRKAVRIVPNASFMAKNELPTQRRKPFVLPSLRLRGRPHPLCPVQTLYSYLKHARAFPSSFIFVNPRSGKDCSKFTIGQMIKRTVRWACPNSFPKPHDLRKISVSKAYFGSLSSSLIRNRASWKSSTVFARHYLSKTMRSRTRCVALRSRLGPSFL